MPTTIIKLEEAITNLKRQDFHPSRELALTLISAAHTALLTSQADGDPAAAHEVRKKLKTIEDWFKLQRARLAESNLVVAERLRAERAIGGMLADPKTGVRRGGDRKSTSHDARLISRLPAGLLWSDSSRWQRAAEVAEADFEQWVMDMTAAEQEISTAALLRLWGQLFGPDETDMPPLPPGKYRCIVIDPPWPMPKIQREERPLQSAYLDYPTMSMEKIAALPIQDKAYGDGCHVYLWVTHKYLPVGLSLLESWGVEYECLMTWNKPTGITPFSWMYNTEHVLFGRVGDLPLRAMGLKLSFDAPVKGHSSKPDVFYERVLQASPEPRLEMFARREREGFEVWGNEIRS